MHFSREAGFKLMKRATFISCFSVFILILLAAAGMMFHGGTAVAENLLENGSFEELDAAGMPAGWVTDAYLLDEGYSVFAVDKEACSPDGGNAVSIQNIAMNDARFVQKVTVEPETLYCFSGFIRAEDVEEGLGGNLSIEGLYVFSESVYDTDGEWEYIEWYGETGEDQTSVTLFIRLGGYSGESKGKVWFDGLELAEADEVPGEGIADLWYPRRTISYYDEDAGDEEEIGNESAAWPRLILLCFLYSVFAALITRSKEEESKPEPAGANRITVFLLIVLGVALGLRVLLSGLIEGYMVDVNCFTSWGRTMAVYGPLGFYPESGFCDYPPAYVWVLGLNSLISGWFASDSVTLTRIIFRFVPSLCDVVICWVLYRFAIRRDVNKRTAAFFCAALAFNPLPILNSAAWGQMDSVLCLFLLLVAVFAVEGKWEGALPCYMLSVLIKPQALMLGFLGLTATVFAWIRNPECRKKILIGLGCALAVALVIIIPFGIRQTPGWLITQYAGTLASYPYATVNTANFYYLFNGNWNAIGNSAPVIVSILLAAFSTVYGVVWMVRIRHHAEKPRLMWMEPILIGLFAIWFILCAAISASWGWIGSGAMAFVFLIVLSLFIRKQDISFLPYTGALLFILLYVFGVKMHERYIFPAIFLLALAWMIHRDRRIIPLMLLFSATVFLNEGIVLDNSIRLGSAQGHLNNDTKVLAQILSILHIFSAGYSVHLGMELCLNKTRQSAFRPLFTEKLLDNRLHWTKQDTAILCGLMVLYSMVCFSTLGSTKAPQTAWSSTDYEESVTFDLGEERDSFSILYFSRVSRYDFSVAVSPDGENWSDESWAEMNQGQCWKWKYVTESFTGGDGSRTFNSGARQWFSGRYVRLTAHQIGLTLCELIFRDENGQILPASVFNREKAVTDSSLYSDPKALLDEQNTLEALPLWFSTDLKEAEGEENPLIAQPGWWNSTYFDEIYHARTAYEFLQGSVPYETSHPPLGKVLMSWGIALFGMTPFGWRFAGALAGVAMLAGMYLIGKQLTKSTAIGTAMGSMLALDCMHLTQTQIATIDSFPVLFILFSWFFMLRFMQTDIGSEKQHRMLTDLACCGFFMGLGIASKWIGIYSGAGLAVVFFTHCICWMYASRKATGKTNAFRKVFRLCIWCIPLFVAVPIAIYLLSYIPYFSYKHPASLSSFISDVWNAQIGMFNYHSTPGLGMDHPFYSPWYEWPVIGKPMYYATKMYVYNDDFSHSIFCIGNPVIWLPALGTMLLCMIGWCQSITRRSVPSGITRDLQFGTETGLFFLLIGFLAQYLPWMLVPRGTYIYHYFASVPFLIVSIGLVLHQIRLHSRKAGNIILILFLTTCAGSFLLFFPYISGIYAPVKWLDFGKHFLRIWY